MRGRGDECGHGCNSGGVQTAQEESLEDTKLKMAFDLDKYMPIVAVLTTFFLTKFLLPQ